MWIKPLPATTPEDRVVGASIQPCGDGSGVWWAVIDQRTGCTLWRIEARDFRTALDEKRRLCAAVSGKSGWAYLDRVRD